jgi:hypothetical protein
MITIQWNYDQGSRSSRAGTSVSIVSLLASVLTGETLPAIAVGQSG